MCFLRNLAAPRRFDEKPRTKQDEVNSLAFFNSDWGLKDVPENYNQVAFNPFALDLSGETVNLVKKPLKEPSSVTFDADIYQKAPTKNPTKRLDGSISASMIAGLDPLKDSVFGDLFGGAKQSKLVERSDVRSVPTSVGKPEVYADLAADWRNDAVNDSKSGLIQVSNDRTRIREMDKANEKIHWYGTAAEAYAESIEQNEPMVMVFEEAGPWTDKLNAELNHPAVQQYASEAVFAKVSPSSDVVAKNMATALGVERLPTISILDPDPKMISERGRIEGFQTGDVLGGDLERFIRGWKEPPKQKNDALVRTTMV